MYVEPTGRAATEDRSLDLLLAGYAARCLDAPLLALVAAHLELRPENRAYVAGLEAAHGVFLEAVNPVPLAGRDRRLVNIFASRDTQDETRRPVQSNSAASRPSLPAPLRRLAGCDYDGLRWDRMGRAVEEAVVATGNFGKASFVRCRPGARCDAHFHSGPAAILVLAGGFSDEHGHYRPGDICIAEENRSYKPMTDGHEYCVCFLSEEIPQQGGSIGRLLQRLLGE